MCIGSVLSGGLFETRFIDSAHGVRREEESAADAVDSTASDVWVHRREKPGVLAAAL
jgi:hypothetical protein